MILEIAYAPCRVSGRCMEEAMPTEPKLYWGYSSCGVEL